MMRGSALSAIAVVGLSTSLVAGAASRATSLHSHHRGLPQLNVLAGSAHWLVYDKQTPSKITVFARGRAGHRRTLRTESQVNNNGLSNEHFSLLGNRLTAVDGFVGNGQTSLLWWNLKSHRHGRKPIKAGGYTDDGTAPNGWILYRGNRPYWQKMSGKVSSLGGPRIIAEVVDKRGFASTTIHSARVKVRYQKWASPKHSTTLLASPPAYSCGGSNGLDVSCSHQPIENGGYLATDKVSIVSARAKAVHTTNHCADGTVPKDAYGLSNPDLAPYKSFLPVLVGHDVAFRACNAFQFLSDTGSMTAFHGKLNGQGQYPVSAYGALVYSANKGKAIYSVVPGDHHATVLISLK